LREASLPVSLWKTSNTQEEVPTRPDVHRLERSLRHAYKHDLPKRDVVALLRALVDHAPSGSEGAAELRLELAENLLRGDSAQVSAWEAARLAQDVLALPDPTLERSARAHAVQGLAQTLLGNYRSARTAYRSALRLDASDPVVAHNLGHLLASVFDDERGALPLLRRAHLELRGNPEVAASYAHALFSYGKPELAERVLRSTGANAEQIRSWVEAWT
jgi:tetratricopeptide (TPR) repeat protein